MHCVLMINGWGGKAVLNGLLEAKGFNLSILTHDETILNLAQKCGHRIVNTIPNCCDLVVCAGWKKRIMPEDIRNNKILNIHYSLLPGYRGLHSVVWALLNNERKLGYTVHRINEEFDDGPIIFQHSVDNDFISTSSDYMLRFNAHVTNNIAGVLFDYQNGLLNEIRQDKSKASWVGKRSFQDCEIDFTKPIKYQKAFFRALVSPYPLPYFKSKGVLISVTAVDYFHCSVETHLGRVLNIDKEGMWVSVPEGYLVIKEIVSHATGEKVGLQNFNIGQFLND